DDHDVATCRDGGGVARRGFPRGGPFRGRAPPWSEVASHSTRFAVRSGPPVLTVAEPRGGPWSSSPLRLLSLHTFPAETPSQQLLTLARWTRDYDEWKAWFVKWRGRIEPGLFSAKPRRQAPVPPAWLPDACTSLVDQSGPLSEACRAWREWLHDTDGVGLLMQQAAHTQQQQEAVEKTVWWEHIHLD